MSASSDDVYNALISSGLSEEEIKDKVSKKVRELQGYMTTQGALFLVAKDFGIEDTPEMGPDVHAEMEQEIDYDDFTIEISEVVKGLSNIVLLGRIVEVFRLHPFTRKDGTPGLVGSFLLTDKSGTIKVVLWGDDAKIMESLFFQPNELIRVIGGYAKEGRDNLFEVHLSRQGKVILGSEGIDSKNLPSEINDKTLNSSPTISVKDLYNKEGFIKKVEGVIAKIDEFKEINKKDGGKTFLLKFIINDDSTAISVIVWGMQAVDCIKGINEGNLIELSNVVVKLNSYSNQKELTFTKNTIFKLF